MKALSVRQPYAALIQAGLKLLEWRDWPTEYRGPVAIHVSRTMTGSELAIAYHATVRKALRELGYTGLLTMPRGVVVGVCDLVHCHDTQTPGFEIPESEALTGWTACRFAFQLANFRPCQPFAWRGNQYLWEIPDRAVQKALQLAQATPA
jgi:hypothetical protein